MALMDWREVRALSFSLEVRLLGPFEVLVDGQQVAMPAGRLRALLAALAMRATEAVPTDGLIAAVWDDHELPSDARRSLQIAIVRLRALIGAERIETQSGTYMLTCPADCVDGLRLLGATADAAAELDLLDVLSLWRGEPFQGVPSPLLKATAGIRLTEAYLTVFERRIDRDLAEGRYGGLVTELRDLTGKYPLRESLWERLIDVLDRSGRHAEALECYEEVRTRVADELGVDPSPALRALHTGLLRAETEPPQVRARTMPRQLPGDVRQFIGRAEQLTALTSALADHRETAAVVTNVHGAGGVGKTSLVVHWARQMSESFPDGQLFINLHGYGPGEPLSEGEALDLLLHGLGLPAAQIPPSADGRSALLRTTLADRRVLLVLDNARNADQIRPLLPGTGMVVVTSRSQLRSLTAREGAIRIALDRLTRAESRAMLSSSLPESTRSGSEVDELAQLCDHLPLALAIVAERAARLPRPSIDDLIEELRGEQRRLDSFDTGDDQLTSVRTVLTTSYAALPPQAARLFRLLGLHPGLSVSVPAAAALTGTSVSAAARLLDRLEDAHLAHQTARRRYELHDLVGSFAAECALAESAEERDCASVRIMGWYMHSAEAASVKLGQRHTPTRRDESPFGVEALTFDDSRQAMEWLDSEYRTLLTIVRGAVAGGRNQVVFTVVRSLFRYLLTRRPPAEALELQLLAVDAARADGDALAEAVATNQRGSSYGRLGEYERATDWFEQALDLFRAAGDVDGQATALGNIGMIHELDGRPELALAAQEQALALAGQTGEPAAVSSILNNLATTQLQMTRFEAAAQSAAKAMEINRRQGDLTAEAISTDTLGLAKLALDHHDAAIRCFTRAITIHHRMGSGWSEAFTLRNLGRAECAMGRLDAARRSWECALQLLDRDEAPDNPQLSRSELRCLLGGL
ncbi:tetratricopeptide repeat protein [Streptomyces sp. SID13031]|uniref:AfsR/SARP family transcriptional regulator n=1 Tax=Streptomyces sp. SID13031 TaxID=2706046 RepID=UPI0013C6228A|nr:tetratricopeptide repeat protein [Streptomyces sp. SID13031]NEA31243.1 tetratricopeptide repeat protein [Streptomyces sp. SID13031]